MRIFILGARSESTLPPAHWQQLNYLFPRNYFEIYFIGPEVGLPMLTATDSRRLKGQGYQFTSENEFGVPSYKLNVSQNLTITCLQSSYENLHDQFGPFDPYTDTFFSFSPGLGFPHQEIATPNRTPNVDVDDKNPGAVTAQPRVQAETTWKATLQKILSTKCPLFFTAFSPLDLQRDVSALYGTNPPSFRYGGSNSRLREFSDYVGAPAAPVGHIEGVTDEFELILTPGKNTFGSLRWEIAEWDLRVAIKTNWGVWGIRGKNYEVVEKGQREEV
jgi:splicing suppressor protein 51